MSTSKKTSGHSIKEVSFSKGRLICECLEVFIAPNSESLSAAHRKHRISKGIVLSSSVSYGPTRKEIIEREYESFQKKNVQN